MKKIFALLLVVCMLLPSIVACGETQEPPASSSEPSTESSAPDSSKPASSSKPSGGTVSSKDDATTDSSNTTDSSVVPPVSSDETGDSKDDTTDSSVVPPASSDDTYGSAGDTTESTDVPPASSDKTDDSKDDPTDSSVVPPASSDKTDDSEDDPTDSSVVPPPASSDNTDGSEGDTTGSTTTPNPPIQEPPVQEDPPTVIEKWSGKTLNILATTWGGAEPGAPWSQVELTVGPNDWNSTAGFGYLINSAVLRRAADIKTTYGVELNWINARGDHIATLLSEAIVAGSDSTKYHIAMPRMLEAQDIVATNSIYDLANRRYIDLTKSYYNQTSVESYSIQEHTLFVGGDFSFLDEETSYLTYYNVAMTKGIKDFPNLYQMVKNGKWTIEQMTNIAKLVTKNNGEPEWTDDDTYGYGTGNLSRFYQYSGIKQVSVGETEYGIEYVITLNDPKVSTLIDKILVIKNSEWARTDWTGGFGGMQKAFEEGRLLFYDEVIQKCSYFKNQNDSFKVGLLPCPKLNESQATYYTPCSYQSVVMCIPKATTDREMSDYFFEILSYTGQKHIMTAYKENLKTTLDSDTSAESMEIIEKYIFSNLCYDQGYMYGWDGLLNSVQSESYSSGKPNFTAVYEAAIEQATETVSRWNMSWYDYTDTVKK